jgi:hypothetical protein
MSSSALTGSPLYTSIIRAYELALQLFFQYISKPTRGREVLNL